MRRSKEWLLPACGLFRQGKKFEAEGSGLFEQETDACRRPGVGAEDEEFAVFDASCADSFHKCLYRWKDASVVGR